MVTPPKTAKILAFSKKRSTTRGVSKRKQQSRKQKYEKQKQNDAAMERNRQISRQNQTIKRERAKIATETIATQARQIERLQARIAILEQQDLPGDENDEILDEMDEPSEKAEADVRANPKWWEPVEARACESIDKCLEWHKVIGIEKSVFDKLADDYKIAYKNTTWHGTKAKGARTATTLSARSALFVCLHFFRQYLVGANMALIYGCHQRTLARIYRRVLTALCVKFHRVLSMPAPEELELLKDPKFVGTPLEGVVCYVDGTIWQAPRSTRNLSVTGPDPYYSGAKHKNGLNMLAIVNSNGHILMVSRNYPASQVDQAIWNRETIRGWFMNQMYGICGDGGFTFNKVGELDQIIGVAPKSVAPSRTKDMTPAQILQRKQDNEFISSHRVIVENVFGRLKDWKILGTFCRHYKPSYATGRGRSNYLNIDNITQVISCIHNLDIILHPLRANN